jgi:putative tricarboxylic transport membrane protein
MKDQHGSPGEEPSLVSRRTMEIVVALAFLVASAIVLYDSVRLGFRWQEGLGPASGYFPFYIALIMAGASLVNLVNAIRDPSARDASFVAVPAFRKVLAVFIPLIAFVFATAFIGIYLAAAIFIIFFMMYFGRFGVLQAVTVGAGVPLALFFMFERWFLVPLPKGPLEAMLGY